MTRALYQYRPNNLHALEMLIIADRRKECREGYFADLLLTTLHYISRGSDTYPSIHDVFPTYMRRSDRGMTNEAQQRMLVNQWKKKREARTRHEQ